MKLLNNETVNIGTKRIGVFETLVLGIFGTTVASVWPQLLTEVLSQTMERIRPALNDANVHTASKLLR